MVLNNDIYSKFIESIKLNKKFRENEVKKCHHLYVKVDSENEEIVECAKCGLTNKYSLPKEIYTTSFGNLKDYINDEVELFNKYHKQYNLNDLESIESNHIGVLYIISKRLRPFSKEDKLLEIMKSLNDMEDDIEREHTYDVCDSYYLVRRYKDSNYKEHAWSNERIIEEINKYADELKMDVSLLTVFDFQVHFDYRVSENRIIKALMEINNKNKVFLKKINR